MGDSLWNLPLPYYHSQLLPRKELITSSGALILMATTLETTPDHLVWWPGRLMLLVPLDFIYMHALKAVA